MYLNKIDKLLFYELTKLKCNGLECVFTSTNIIFFIKEKYKTIRY